MHKNCCHLSGIYIHIMHFSQMFYMDLGNYDWLQNVFQEPVRIGASTTATGDPFDGSISCLQVYDYALDIATVHWKKYCPDVPLGVKSLPCNPGEHYYDGQCYKIALTKASFAQAEVLCLPPKDSRYRSQMMWTFNRIHWDHVSRMVEKETGYSSMWAGISDMDEDMLFTTRYGRHLLIYVLLIYY